MRASHVVRWSHSLIGVSVIWVASATGTFATDLFYDTFDVGSPATRSNDVADAMDLAWWLRDASKQTLSVVADTGTPGIGSGNALYANNNAKDLPLIGNDFGLASLGASVGDVLKLSFDVRFLSSDNAIFRFGLANSNGTGVTADSQTASINDIGYFGQFSLKDTVLPTGVFKDRGTDTGGQLWLGTDLTNLTTSVSSLTLTNNDFTKHTVEFTLTRTAAGVAMEFSVDGLVRASGSDTNSTITSFDEVAFTHENKTVDYRLDNVRLQATAIPEPETLGLVGLGLIAMTAALRWRRNK